MAGGIADLYDNVNRENARIELRALQAEEQDLYRQLMTRRIDAAAYTVRIEFIERQTQLIRDRYPTL